MTWVKAMNRGVITGAELSKPSITASPLASARTSSVALSSSGPSSDLMPASKRKGRVLSSLLK